MRPTAQPSLTLILLALALSPHSHAQQNTQNLLLPFPSTHPEGPARPARSGLPPGARVLRDLEYVPSGHERQRLDLYLPAGAGRWPVIIWVHGGAFRAGSKDQCPAVPYVGEGFAVASVNYRLSQHAIFPAQIEDCKAAVRWLRAHAAQYNLDPDRFGAWGASAGGHLVAMLGVTSGVKEFDRGSNLEYSSRVQAVCDWFGPTDFTQMNKFKGDMDHDAPDSPESQLIGGPVQQNKDKAARANPITYVTNDDPPFLIMHGSQDPLVPLNQSELLRNALQKVGVPVTFHAVQGAGHGFSGPEIDKLVRDFFARHLLDRQPNH
jgi:acetyl esterase/lipase